MLSLELINNINCKIGYCFSYNIKNKHTAIIYLSKKDKKMYQNTTKYTDSTPTRHLKIYQIAEGYCYNSDSLFLWDFILPHIKRNTKILELGSGSGIVGLLCARDREITLCQIEKQAVYALMNTKNAQINHIDSIVIHADCNTLLQSDNILAQLHANMLCNDEKLQTLIAQQTLQAKTNNTESSLDMQRLAASSLVQKTNITSLPYFDIMISNPPFYPIHTLSSHNPLKAQATQSHNLPFETMLMVAKKMLKPHAKFIFCYTPSMLGQILESLRSFGFGVEFLRFVYPRIDKDSTLVLICARTHSKVQTHVLPPLITHYGKAQQDNTKEVQAIYRAGHTQSIKIAYHDIVWEYLY